MSRPLETEYASSYQSYVAHVNEDEILPAMRSQNDAQRMWSLLILEVWCRVFLEHDPTAPSAATLHDLTA